MPFGYPYALEAQNGLYWFELSVSKKKESHEMPHFIVLSHNITDRKESEAKLKLAASVFTYAREGIMITDASGKIVEVNETFTYITGYAYDDVVGTKPPRLKIGDDKGSFFISKCGNRSLKMGIGMVKFPIVVSRVKFTFR